MNSNAELPWVEARNILTDVYTIYMDDSIAKLESRGLERGVRGGNRGGGYVKGSRGK